MKSSNKLALGKIGSAWGIRGEVRLHLYNPDSEILQQTRSLEIEKTGFSFESLKVLSIKQSPKGPLVLFENYDSPEKVKVLSGKEFYVSEELLKAQKKKDEIYQFELKGFRVLGEKGEGVGLVQNIVSYGASDILEIKDEAGRELLIPYVSDFVDRLDLKEKVIYLKQSPEEA